MREFIRYIVVRYIRTRTRRNVYITAKLIRYLPTRKLNGTRPTSRNDVLAFNNPPPSLSLSIGLPMFAGRVFIKPGDTVVASRSEGT